MRRRASSSDLDWENPYRTVRRPILADNVVVASHPLAAQAGLHALFAGGNAIDAAVAAAAVIAVVEPTNNGLGGDAFAQVWHEGLLHGVNGSGRAPASWTREHFAAYDAMPERGWDSVTVPGAVSLWRELSQRFGRWPLERSLERAIHYAAHGFAVAPQVAQKWAQQGPKLRTEPGFADAFLAQGRTPRPSERFRLEGLQGTLQRIAASHGRDFYEGETAQRVARFARETGGAMDERDLAHHRASLDAPISVDYRGLALHEMPPNGQGVVALMALRMLSHHALDRLPVDSAPAIHLQIEAIKLAFADARRCVADADHLHVPVVQLLDHDYLAARSRLIDPRRAQEFGPGVTSLAGTVYLATADRDGSVVSLIQSNYMGFGSGIVVPGTGVALHNRGACFTLERRHPNEVAPRKRPLHTILPGMVMRDGAPIAAIGATGGSYQPQGHVQFLVQLAAGRNPQSIIDAPRFRVDAGLKVTFEPGFARPTLDELRSFGHDVNAQDDTSWDFGGMQTIVRVGDGWLGASDARRDSAAVGF